MHQAVHVVVCQGQTTGAAHLVTHLAAYQSCAAHSCCLCQTVAFGGRHPRCHCCFYAWAWMQQQMGRHTGWWSTRECRCLAMQFPTCSCNATWKLHNGPVVCTHALHLPQHLQLTFQCGTQLACGVSARCQLLLRQHIYVWLCMLRWEHLPGSLAAELQPWFCMFFALV